MVDNLSLRIYASDSAVGGVLSQEDHSWKLRPISFFSSILNESQRKYSVGEKEAWAIVAASRKISKYLQAGGLVNISSDQNPLVWLRQKRDPRGKFARWLLELEELNYVVKHRRRYFWYPFKIWGGQKVISLPHY